MPRCRRLDLELTRRPQTVVFAAGSQPESAQLTMADLLRHEQVTALPLIKQAGEDDKDWVR